MGVWYTILLHTIFSDSAVVYINEEDIGLALKELLPKYNLKREDIFLTSKLCKFMCNYFLKNCAVD